MFQELGEQSYGQVPYNAQQGESTMNLLYMDRTASMQVSRNAVASGLACWSTLCGAIHPVCFICKSLT